VVAWNNGKGTKNYDGGLVIIKERVVKRDLIHWSPRSPITISERSKEKYQDA
jgi:hypothetical protein